ncbi:MAG: gamma-glutamylcyclotransferase [Alphaproteobacteria bacterium]
MTVGNETWIFGSGSLMWNPGFDHLEVQPALLRGYHRAFCIYSHYAWGTLERPGLVLGLLPGGSCRGRAFCIAREQTESVLAYLDDRESAPYRRVLVPVALRERTVEAHTYVANPDHRQFAGKLTPEPAADFILQGKGHRGSSREYLQNTVRHLDELGIREGPLHRLLDLVEMAGSAARTRCGDSP